MNRFIAFILLLAVGNLPGSAVYATAPTTETTTAPAGLSGPSATSPTAEKWEYTLFNPTPTEQLRGMATDRPNVCNSPQTIDAGHLQIETGILDYTFYRDRYQGADARLHAWDFGEFNFRLGILDNLEINAAVNAYDTASAHDYTNGANAHAAGFGDTVVGGKLNFWGDEISDEAWASALAIQPQFKIPTADSDIGNGQFEFSLGAPFLINLPDGFHLSFQPGILYERNIFNTGYTAGFENAVAVDRVFWQRLDIYIEYASEVTSEAHVMAVETLDLGGIYQLTPSLTLDSGVNIGLNRASNNFEVVAGFSVRF